MKLWIRSQDKTILTPISEKLQILANIDIPQEQYIVMYNREELGNYNSKERALEVLDEIQELLITYYQSIDYQIVPIYEMPKE